MIIILYLDAGWFRLCWLDVNGAGGSPICSISSFRFTRWWSGLDGGSEGFGIILLPVALKVGSVAWSEERLGGSGISLRATDIVSQVEPSVLDQFPPAVFTDILEQHSLVNLSTIQSNNTWILEKFYYTAWWYFVSRNYLDLDLERTLWSAMALPLTDGVPTLSLEELCCRLRNKSACSSPLMHDAVAAEEFLCDCWSTELQPAASRCDEKDPLFFTK